MANEYDAEFDWNTTDSGLPSDFPGTIEGSEFCYDPEFHDGEDLIWRFTIKSLAPDEVDDQTMKVKVGKHWEPADNGRQVVRDDGKAKNFHGLTNMGLIITSLVKEAEVDMNALVKEKGALPTNVAFWDGLTFQWARRSHDYGGDIGEIDRLLPVELLDAGKGKGGASKASPAPTKAAAPVGKTVAKAAPAPEPSGLTAEVYSALFDIAYSADDAEAFKATAYETVPGATDDEAIIAAIEDVSSDDGIWAKAVAKWQADNS